MRAALMLEGQEGVTWQQWLDIARTCERLGFESLVTSDHYLSVVDTPEPGSNDAWTLLGALAVSTERLRLGTMVSRRHVPAARGPREGGDDGRPHLERTRRARHRRRGGGSASIAATASPSRRSAALRDARGAARDRARPVVGRRVLVPRRSLHARGRAGSSRSRCSDHIRRSSSAARAARGCRGSSRDGPTSSTASAGRPRRSASVVRTRARRGRRAPGRDPSSVTMSFMTWVFVGRTDDEWRARVEHARRMDPSAGPFEDYLADISRDCIVGTVGQAVDRMNAYADGRRAALRAEPRAVRRPRARRAPGRGDHPEGRGLNPPRRPGRRPPRISCSRGGHQPSSAGSGRR